MKELADVLETVLKEAAVLRRNNGAFSVQRVEELVGDVRLAAGEFLTWISEKEAKIRSGHKEPWFRQRFPDWQRQGHARFNPKNARERQYRVLIVPLAHDVDAVRAAARDAARETSQEMAS